MGVRVQDRGLRCRARNRTAPRSDARVGAVASFVGLVRDENDAATVRTLTLEHYPGMTEKALHGIVDEARRRWSIYDAVVIHRVGELSPTDQIVLVAVSSAHRGDAFAACEFIIDYLKTQAPFWKKELTPDGERWVEARASDDERQLAGRSRGSRGSCGVQPLAPA
jgi:molybdopterin synthase catalytic subunit